MNKSNSEKKLIGNKKHHDNLIPVKDTKKQKKEMEHPHLRLLPLTHDQIDIKNTNIIVDVSEYNILESIDLIESCMYYIAFREDPLKVKIDDIVRLKQKFSDLSLMLPKFTISQILFGTKEIQMKYFLSAFLEILLKDLENHNEEISEFYQSFWKDFLDSFLDNRPNVQKFRNFKIDLILTAFSQKDENMIEKYNDLIFSNDFLVMSLDDNIFRCEGINIKEILTKIVSNDFVLNCFAEVLNCQTPDNEASIKQNLLEIIRDLEKICFTKFGSNSILGITIFSGDIILKREWLDEIVRVIGRMRLREDFSYKFFLSIYERINKMNFSFGKKEILKKKYFVFISFIILTIIHEMVHVYRRRYINNNSFDNTPKFKLGSIEFNDGGAGVDFLMFGEILKEIYPMQAEFLMNMENWNFSLNGKDNFQNEFKNITKIDKSPPVPFKSLGGYPFGKCLRSLFRSNLNK